MEVGCPLSTPHFFLSSRVVLPDSSPAAVPVVSSAPVPSNPDLGDSACSGESGFLPTSLCHVLPALLSSLPLTSNDCRPSISSFRC